MGLGSLVPRLKYQRSWDTFLDSKYTPNSNLFQSELPLPTYSGYSSTFRDVTSKMAEVEPINLTGYLRGKSSMQAIKCIR